MSALVIIATISFAPLSTEVSWLARKVQGCSASESSLSWLLGVADAECCLLAFF